MWDLRLKYHLEVRGRLPSDVVDSVPWSFCDGSTCGFSVMPQYWPASLVVMLPIVGVMWRSYAAPCTGLWIIADRRGNSAWWQPSSHPIVLYMPSWPGTAFPGGVQGFREGWFVLALTIWVLCGSDLLWRTPPSLGEPIWCESNHDVYTCSRGRVAMSGGDWTVSCSQVPVARRSWEPVVWHLMTMSFEDTSARVTCSGSETPRHDYWGPGCVQSRDKSDESDLASRWQDHARLRLSRWDEKTGTCHTRG
jgi:hypothetical protein